MQVYLDNAATTPLTPEVFEAMKPYMLEFYGNPSSTHAHGRATRSAIEKARKGVADLLHASPSEIFFTSGGTEADNTAIKCAIESLDIRSAITSPLEHHAVLHALQALAAKKQIKLNYVHTDSKGNIDYDHLKALLDGNERSFVSIMQGNNEIGNLNDIGLISEICAFHDAIFHSDTVQTLAHYPHNLSKLKIHSIIGSAHKFHGPKGAGLLYIKKGHQIAPFIHGGSQERNMRGGTENLYGIIGLAKALEIAYEGMNEHRKHILALKQRMIKGLKERVPGITFNGESGNMDKSLYTVLNVSLPPSTDADMLLFNLDLHKISVSGGSACSSGSQLGSHVLQALSADPERGAIRFSFSKYNTLEEIHYVVDKLANMYNPVSI
ncbi:cysteine desulfurase family protein [Catalinimonas niigatensis]|uniref:cysteine desulfurase family protein n=1 Tax=Catalinimonas niigatensis TaxID=1397264 RepID=UPI002666B6AE|nr:cysteine desulfurase family protein [Catalinimonas niigatensis]WPP48144.1 cysteine desulfurase family protein [Catalinimonas niigatensis]